MTALLQLLMVAIGGALGATARWGIGEAWRVLRARERSAEGRTGGAAARRNPSTMPWPTFLANVGACFLLGIVAVELGSADGPGRLVFLLMATGFCGGMSTLSTAALDTVDLVRRGTAVLATSYVLLTIGACMAALWVGVVIAA